MFEIFQVDLPIGRYVWLVALTLVITSLVSHAPLNFSGDPSAFAVAMLVYTGHSLIIGFLFSLVPQSIMITVALHLLIERSKSSNRSAILFEHVRSGRIQAGIMNVAVLGSSIVCVAAFGARRFGQPSLMVSGLIGLGFVLFTQVIDIRKLFSRDRWALLELRSDGDVKSLVKVFASGKLFSETPLAEDFASALARLLNAKWEFVPDSGTSTGADRSAWLRKEIADDLRILAKMDGYFAGTTLIRELCSSLAFALKVIGISSGTVGAGFLLYLTRRGTPDILEVIRASGTIGIVAVAMAVGGALMFETSLLLFRWLNGESLLTGKPKGNALALVEDSEELPPPVRTGVARARSKRRRRAR